MKNSGLRNLTAVLARIIEIISYVGVGLLVLGSVAILLARNSIIEAYTKGYITLESGVAASAEAQKFWIDALVSGRIVILFIGFAVVAFLTGLIFRNIHNVFKVSNVASPFSEDNVKRIKNIGYLAIALPIVKIVIDILSTFILGTTDYYFGVS